MAGILNTSAALFWTSVTSRQACYPALDAFSRRRVVARLVAGPDERELWLPIFAHVRRLLTTPHRIDRVIPRDAHGYR